MVYVRMLVSHFHLSLVILTLVHPTQTELNFSAVFLHHIVAQPSSLTVRKRLQKYSTVFAVGSLCTRVM